MNLQVIQDAPSAGLPALIDRAVLTLSNARSAAEVLDARDMASAVYDIAKKAARLAKAKSAATEVIKAAYHAQADAMDIEAQAKRRLADEYDAAQERGEVATRQNNPGSVGHVPIENMPATAADIGLSRKDIYEAREIRDAEEVDPGIVRRTLDEALDAGEEPTRAKVKRAVRMLVRPDDRQHQSGRGAICEHVRAAVIALAGLPPAAEVAAYFKGTDAAITISNRLPSAAAWMQEFNAAWEAINADEQE